MINSEDKNNSKDFLEPISGSLYIVATPIGNMSDLSKRAKYILSKVSLIACEDTRRSGIFLKKLDIKASLKSFHKHNTKKRLGELLKILEAGKSIALISDAGLPGISDPGEELVLAAKQLGIKVICIPGPCAALTALVASGLPSNKFSFEGFLPSKKKDRAIAISKIAKQERTTLLYESPYKLIKLLEELGKACGNERPIQVARELTKLHEEFIGPTIDSAINYFKSNEPKGEFTIVLGGNHHIEDSQVDEDSELLYKMKKLINNGYSYSIAAKKVAIETGCSKRLLYSLLHKSSSSDSLSKETVED